MKIYVYADTTNQYTDGECNYCNCVLIDIPENIIREWYNEKECFKDFLNSDYSYLEPSFENWYNAVYTCDSTDGLYEFAIEKGVTPVCGRKCDGWSWY